MLERENLRILLHAQTRVQEKRQPTPLHTIVSHHPVCAEKLEPWARIEKIPSTYFKAVARLLRA
ncbi:hypothetical protein IV102_09275 [bacterium]|nr:hypothetical protein [bacterium]